MDQKFFVSTRRRFQRGDAEWDGYSAWIGLPHLQEVRTLDAALNKYVDKCGSLYGEPSQLESMVSMLPKPAFDREYYLLGILLESDAALAGVDGYEFLGCDLS